jgi:spore coat protein U-like protein
MWLDQSRHIPSTSTVAFRQANSAASVRATRVEARKRLEENGQSAEVASTRVRANMPQVDYLRATLAAFLIAVASSAHAACTIFLAVGPAFGTYDTLSFAPLDAVGTISYQCSPPKPTVQISTGSSGSYSARTMRSGAATLLYNLYLDAARTMVWGDGSAGTFTDSPNPGNVTRSIPVYGRIPANQDAASGSYSDTILVTFVF